MKYKRKRILVFLSVFAIAIASFAGAFQFNLIVNASTDGIAYYGEQLSTETPGALGGSEYAGYSWTDAETDYFGEAGEQTFVVSNGNNYKNLTVTIQPRGLSPVLKYSNSSSTIPAEWAGNSNKHTLSDFMGTTTFNANGGVFEPNVMEVTDSLPTKVGDVSIMTLEQVYVAFGGSTSSTDIKYDPSHGYNTSTYYMYAINDTPMTNDSSLSTSDNLKAVGIDWYKALHKGEQSCWTVGDHRLFGGPLYLVYHTGSGCGFGWYFSERGDFTGSAGGDAWHDDVPGSVYVAVVCAVGDAANYTTHTGTNNVGSAVAFPTEPTRENYDFDGWWTTSDNSGEKVTSITQEGTPKTYYAHWSVPDTIVVTNSLPTKSRDVSIMTLKELYTALPSGNGLDPSYGYDTSTYYIYAINDTAGTDDALSNSTSANLKAVGIDWYQQLNKPTTAINNWVNAGNGSHRVFGGPLYYVYNSSRSSGTYSIYWYYSNNKYYNSVNGNYWVTPVDGSVYVAVVHK